MPALSLKQQERLVRYHFPKAEIRSTTVMGERCLAMQLKLQPTPTSDQYRVLFCFTAVDPPMVFVVDPLPVRHIDGKPTPHLNRDGTLCLFDPSKDEWSPSDPYVHTIIPWTVRWLFHYEHWRVFGEWWGDAREDPRP